MEYSCQAEKITDTEQEYFQMSSELNSWRMPNKELHFAFCPWRAIWK